MVPKRKIDLWIGRCELRKQFIPVVPNPFGPTLPGLWEGSQIAAGKSVRWGKFRDVIPELPCQTTREHTASLPWVLGYVWTKLNSTFQFDHDLLLRAVLSHDMGEWKHKDTIAA